MYDSTKIDFLTPNLIKFFFFKYLDVSEDYDGIRVASMGIQMVANKRKVLEGKGSISHKEAIEKAEKEFLIYREREMNLFESDFDKLIKQIKDK